MISMVFFSSVSFFYYFVCYLIIIVPVLGVLAGTKVYSFKDLLGGCIGRFNVFSLSLYLLRVSGVPPFLGFFMKAYALYSIAVYHRLVIAIIFCLFAAVRLRYYLSFFFIVLLSTSYRVCDDKVWESGELSPDEGCVNPFFYLLGGLSLGGFPFIAVLIL